MNYFVMLYDEEEIDDGANFEEFSNLPFEDYMFDKCISLKDKYSDDVLLIMDKGEANWRVLYDITDNIFRLLIVSEPLKEILETFDCGDIEFLPVSIKNQRDKIEKEQYYIAHLVDSVDYIDTEKSTVEYRSMNESRIFSVENITLKKIPENRDLFRADYYPNCYVVSERLKNKIEEEEFEGILFVPIEKFSSTKYM